jgi:hypothetical protein
MKLGFGFGGWALLEGESQETLPSITELANVDYLDAPPYRSLKKINRGLGGLLRGEKASRLNGLVQT